MPEPAPNAVVDQSLIAIVTTFADRAAAVACGRRLVAGRLAACVQVDGPITSIYRWRDDVETAAEWRCTCKTTPAGQDACVAAILADHPYETPELTIIPAGATAAYAAWAEGSVAIS